MQATRDSLSISEANALALLRRKLQEGEFMADAMEWARQTYQLSERSLARVVRAYDEQQAQAEGCNCGETDPAILQCEVHGPRE